MILEQIPSVATSRPYSLPAANRQAWRSSQAPGKPRGNTGVHATHHSGLGGLLPGPVAVLGLEVSYAPSMSKATHLLIAIVACTLLACGGSKQVPSQTPRGEPPTAEEDTAAGPATEEPPAALAPNDQPPASTVTVTRLSGSATAPTTGGSAAGGPPTTVTVSLEGDAILLGLTNFTFYCDPAPTFTARMEGDHVVVQAQPPTTSVSRCVGPHSARLRLDGVPTGEHTISVRSVDDQEVATTQVTTPTSSSAP